MNDNKILTADTPADTLAAHVDNHIALPEAAKLDNAPLMDEVTAHPNLPPHAIEKLYSHATAHQVNSNLAATGQAEMGHLSNEAVENIMDNPNTPVNIKQAFANATYHPDNPQSSLHKKIANSGVVPEADLRSMSEAALGQGESPHIYEHISPDYYMHYFKARSQQDPENLSREEQSSHSKESQLGSEGLIQSKKHTPETLNETVDAFINNKHAGHNRSVLMRKLVDNRQDLSKDQLNKIHQWHEANPAENGWRHDQLLGNVLSHSNVDPSLLAKYSQGEDKHTEALEHPNLPKESMDAAIRKLDDPNSWDQRSTTNSLLKNPSISKEQVKALLDKGSDNALRHKLTSEDDIRTHWNATDKKQGAARNILDAQNTPPDVLKEIVNHKNQEVAIQALKHPKADLSVVEEGLKRRAKDVQEAARTHPLVASSQVKAGLKSGKVSLTNAYEDKDYKQHFDTMSPQDQEEIFKTAHDKYKGLDLKDIQTKTKEPIPNIIYNKYQLANDQRVPEAIRETQVNDLVDMFKDRVSSTQTPSKAPKILHADHKTDQTRIVRAVVDLAAHNNVNAQGAVLNNPGVLSQIHEHINLDEASPKFLTDIYNKRNANVNSTTPMYDDYGRPTKFDQHGYLSGALFKSPNLPEDIFHKMATDPQIVDQMGLTTDSMDKAFSRYDDLSDDEKNAKFNPIIDAFNADQGNIPTAITAILRSKAPAQSWDKAFTSLSPAQRSDLFGTSTKAIKERRPDIFKRAVLGHYTEGEVRGNRYSSQSMALQYLSPESSEDHNTLKELISNDDQSNNTQLMKHVPTSMYEKNYDIINHAYASGNQPLGNAMTAKKISHDTKNLPYYDKSSGPPSPDAQNLVNEISQHITASPILDPATETDNPLATKWMELLSHSGDRSNGSNGSNWATDLVSKGANLDFLADMPGSDGNFLKQKAISYGLLSSGKLDEIAQNASLSDILQIPEQSKRGALLARYLSKPSLSSDELALLSRNVKYNDIFTSTSSSRGKELTLDELDSNQAKINHLVGQYQAANDPDQFRAFLRSAMNDKASAHTLADRKKLANGIFAHLDTLQYSTAEDKNAIKYSAVQVLRGLDLSGTRPLTQLESEVVKSGDIGTMIKMSQNDDLSSKGVTKLAQLASQSDKLNLPQMAALSDNFSYTTPQSDVLNMAKAFEVKASQSPLSAGTTKAKLDFLSNLSKTFDPDGDDDHKEKNEFVLNYIKRAALDSDKQLSAVANNRLFSMSRQLYSSDPDQAMNIYVNLPNDIELTRRSVGYDMANDPRFVEASAEGYKLGLLARMAVVLTGKNVRILTSRAISDVGVEIDKKELFTNLESNKFAYPEDTVKLARSMSNNDFNVMAKQIGQSMTGNLIFAAHAKLNDLDAAMTDPNIVSLNAPFMGDEHRNHIVYNMNSIAKVIRNATFKDDTLNLKDKLNKVSEMIDKMHVNLKTITDHMQQNPGPSHVDFGRDVGFIDDITTSLASTGLALDKPDAMKIFDMVKMSSSLNKKVGFTDDSLERNEFDKLAGLVKNAENLEDQDWKEILQHSPNSVMALSQRSEIPPEALNNIDYKLYEHHVAVDPKKLDVQNVFMNESKQWFSKMSPNDLNVHGKNLLNMYTRMMSNGKILRHSDYETAMKEGMAYLAPSLTHQDVGNLLNNTQDHTIRMQIHRSAVENGVGGKETLKSYLREYQDQWTSFRNSKRLADIPNGNKAQIEQELSTIVKSPFIDEEISNNITDMFQQNPQVMSETLKQMLNNPKVPDKTVDNVTEQVLNNFNSQFNKFNARITSELASQLMQHPNITEDKLTELFKTSNSQFPKFFESSGKFNPALTNPTYGGKLFRAMPIEVPSDVSNAATNKMIKSLSLQAKDSMKMQEVLSLIPAEGVSWADFKRKYPQQEKTLPPSVKSIFTAANNKPVKPEAFVQAIKSMDDNAKKYHMTYSHWTSGLQKHNSKSSPNLVVQINNSEESEKTLSQDPKLWGLYQHLLQSTNGIQNGSIGLHPTTPHLVSWSRVDTDQNGSAWAIEEYQSDFAQKFRKNLRTLIKRSPSGLNINGHTIAPQELADYSTKIDKHLDDWTDASMQAVIENAKANGITKLYMHGCELRSYMSNASQYTREFWDNTNTKPQTVGFRKIYQDNPPKYGFQECDYTDYPVHSTQMLKDLKQAKLSTKCWVLDLSPKTGKK